MNRLFIYFFINIFLNSSNVFAQSQIQWLTWEQAVEKSKKEKRKVFVDVHTEWCGWCKKMHKTTFSDERIIKYINKNYYAIKLDAEKKENIQLKGKTFEFTRYGSRGYHQLATTLLNGKMSFPSLVFMDEDFNVIQAIPGYQDELNFYMIATYFGENLHKSKPWNIYVEEFQQKELARKH